MGVSGVACPPDPIQQHPTYESALAAFEQLPSVRILFDNGAGSDPGAPLPGFEDSFPRFPVPGTRARAWYLSSGGQLTDDPPKRAGTNSFTWNAKARPLTNFSGDTAAGEGGLWTATPPYKWTQNPAGTALSYLSKPFGPDTTIIGAGAVHLWMRASKPNVDLQATITEVRPDGKEVFVQGGWLRANERKLDAKKSKPLEPVLSLRQRDVRPVPAKRFVKATIPLYYQGHAYRAGSRIRVIISAPNGDQPIWSFTTRPKGKAKVGVAFSKSRPSRLVLPLIQDVRVPTGLPPCPGLRAEPCRDYKAFVNRK
jgi:predicted acyl esterase